MLLTAAATLVVLLAVVANWGASKRLGIDFGYLYLTATGVATRAPIYDVSWQATSFAAQLQLPPPKALAYPPGTGLVLLPFAVLQYSTAQTLWFGILIMSALVGIGLLIRQLRPSAPAAVWVLVAGLVLLTACLRWGITPLQGAPLMMGLLALAMLGLHAGRTWVVFAIVVFALAFKFTLAIPFVGLLVLYRRFGLLAGAVASVGLLNLIGFARVGGIAALQGYSNGMARFEQLGTIDSPDPWDTQSIPRLDWTVLINGFVRDLQVSHAVAIVIAALVTLWLLKECLAIGRPASLATAGAFLTPLVLLTLESVYHHHYDASLVVVPLLVVFASWRELELRKQMGAVLLLTPLMVVLAFLPIAGAQHVLTLAFGELGLGFLNISFPLATTLAMLGSLLVLRRAASRQTTLDARTASLVDVAHVRTRRPSRATAYPR